MSVFLTDTGWRALAAPDIPATSGPVNISQITPSGLTGQVIQDIGSNTLGWRYPNFIGGPGGYVVVPVNETGGLTVGSIGANVVGYHRFILPVTLLVSRLMFYVSNPDPGFYASVGLYDFNGNRTIHTDPIELTVSGGVAFQDIDPTPILPGSYLWCWTTDSNAATFLLLSEAPEYLALINGGVTLHYGTATNVSVAGALPATLGALAANSDTSMVGVLQG